LRGEELGRIKKSQGASLCSGERGEKRARLDCSNIREPQKRKRRGTGGKGIFQTGVNWEGGKKHVEAPLMNRGKKKDLIDFGFEDELSY